MLQVFFYSTFLGSIFIGGVLYEKKEIYLYQTLLALLTFVTNHLRLKLLEFIHQSNPAKINRKIYKNYLSE